jgi:hypothetical protein
VEIHDPTIDVAVAAREPRRLTRPQRLVLTAILAVGLLGVGGVALVQAADPTSSPSTTTTTTESSNGSGGGTTRGPGHDCPNKDGTSSSTSSSSTTSSSN